MEIQARPFANILDETYCPEDQSVGCEGCAGDDACLIRIHDEYKCWELELHGFECEICKMEKEGE